MCNATKLRNPATDISREQGRARIPGDGLEEPTVDAEGSAEALTTGDVSVNTKTNQTDPTALL